MHLCHSCFSAIVSFRYVLVFLNFLGFCFTSNKYHLLKLMILNFRSQRILFLCKHNFCYWWGTYPKILNKSISWKYFMFHELPLKFHEMLWKKSFTVYPCLYVFLYVCSCRDYALAICGFIFKQLISIREEKSSCSVTLFFLNCESIIFQNWVIVFPNIFAQNKNFYNNFFCCIWSLRRAHWWNWLLQMELFQIIPCMWHWVETALKRIRDFDKITWCSL